MDEYNPAENGEAMGYAPEEEYPSIDAPQDAAQTDGGTGENAPAADSAGGYAEQQGIAQQEQQAEQSVQQAYQQPYQQPVQPLYGQPQYQQPPYVPNRYTQPQYQPPYGQPQYGAGQQAYPQPQQYAGRAQQPDQQYQPPVQPPYGQPQYQQQPAAPGPYSRPQYQQPVQQPIQQSVQQPVQQPIQQPGQQPVQQPIQQPVQQPIQQPVYRNPAGQPYPPQYPQQYGQPPYGQPPYGQPQYTAQPAEPKPRTSTGTKVFLIILCTLLVALVIGFFIYLSNLASKDKPSNNNNGNSGIVLPTDFYEDIFGKGNGSNNGNGFNNIVNTEEFEEEVTLVADNGETQKRTDDNPYSIGKPDENAKGIELKALPSDKNDSKYTTESAYNAVCDSVVTVELYKGEISDNVLDIVSAGTGTVISSDGYIVTNAHVIGNSRIYTVKVVMNSGKSYQAKIVGYDTWTDLALLKVDAKDLKPVTFGDSSLIEIGQDVIAIGSPGGEKFQNSLTKGIISAVDRELTINKYVRYIQSDAAISPGNSGGPLCNIYGQVIGINTAKTVATYYEAMTFSIPADTVKDIVNDLLHYGYVKGRARIGFSGSEISSEEQYYYGTPSGIYVGEIDEKGAFAGTKIKEGDVITAVDGIEVATFQDIYSVLAQHKPGDKVKVSVFRMEEADE